MKAPKGQKNPDSIVKRAAELANLEPKNLSEANAYYHLSKSMGDMMIVGMNQMAGNYVTKGSACDLGGPLAKQKDGLQAASRNSSYFVRTYYRVDVTLNVPPDKTRRVALFSAWIYPREDLTCIPRRSGGMLGTRGLVKAFQDAVEKNPTGVFVAAGATPELATVIEAGRLAVVAPQLQHPGINKYLPTTLQGLQQKAIAMAAKKATQIIATVVRLFGPDPPRCVCVCVGFRGSQ